MRVNFRENIWAFPHRDKRNGPQYPGVRNKRVSAEWGSTVLELWIHAGSWEVRKKWASCSKHSRE